MPVQKVDPEAVKRRVWIDYQYASKERANTYLDGIQTLLSELKSPNPDIRGVLQKAADLIHNSFWIREVTIGLKDPSDGLYKYEVMSGLKESAWAAHRSISYTPDRFCDSKIYKAKEISKYTKLFLSEDNPYGAEEELTYNRPLMLQMKRKSSEDSLEGDYLDVSILGKDDELMGWIEISGTTMNKLPDTATIKWVEVIASVLGAAMACRNTKGIR